MSTTLWIRCRRAAGLLALALGIAASGPAIGQTAPPKATQIADARGFKEFSDRVQAYLKLRKTVESRLPALKSTELPEMITAYQQAFARKLREARPDARVGDILTADARTAFRRVSGASTGGPRGSGPRADSHHDEPNPQMALVINGVYPGTEPNTALSPGLLAAFPPLPPELVYRVVDRTLILMDVKSRMVVDFARLILPPS